MFIFYIFPSVYYLAVIQYFLLLAALLFPVLKQMTSPNQAAQTLH